jgi:PhnB protein
MTSVNPYLNFNGECREAMSFYKDCLGGELNMQTIAESPMAEQCGAGVGHHIMHAMLQNGGLVVMGSDMQLPDGYAKGTNISLNVNCETEDALKQYFGKLSQGGKVVMEPERMFWGGTFACLTDKYGIKWQFKFNYTHSEN